MLYFGSSNFAGWHIAQAQEAATRLGMVGLASEQSIYSLARRTIELEVLPAAQSYGVGVIPWSPLFGGVLAGVLSKSNEGRASGERTQERLAAHRSQVEAYEAFCAELGEHPANVGLAWLLSRPGVTAPIIGPRTIAQLDDTMRALELTLDEAALNRLDEIWPGPGGTAPEAYAW